MSEVRGGIGSTGLMVEPEPEVAEPIEDERQDAPASEPLFDPTEILAAMAKQSGEISSNLAALIARLDTGDAETAQLRGQVARFEAILPQYNAAFQQLNAKMDALAKQVMRNMRYAALDIATKSRLNNERGEAVVKNAEQYLKFLEPPEPQDAVNARPLDLGKVVDGAAGQVGDPPGEEPPPGTVTH